MDTHLERSRKVQTQLSDKATSAIPVKKSRVERKREAAELSLLQAGYKLIGEQGVDNTSIQNITNLADCSIGAFYSHFKNKDAFVSRVKIEVIEPVGNALDAYAATTTDTLKVFSVSQRFTHELAYHNKAWGSFLVALGFSAQSFSEGLGARMILDIRRGISEGAFTANNELAAITVAAGAFFASAMASSTGLLKVDTPACITSQVLQALGVPKSKADAAAHQPLPEITITSRLVNWPLQEQ